MLMKTVDTAFTNSVARLYESHLVPLIFEPYAVDMAKRVAALKPKRVLEIAAGTGVVTRQLAAMLDPSCEIVATDLNPAMLEEAQNIGTTRPVDWRAPVDAMQLPFEDGVFDVVVCQFGAMFFPDRPHAYREARRVLGAKGTFLFSVWDTIESNEFADAVVAGVAELFPQDPPMFLARTPHGYHDAERVRRDVTAAGYAASGVAIEKIAFMSRAVSAETVSVAYCQGTPMRGEIVTRDPDGLERATRAGTREMARRFGEGEVEGQISALVVSAAR